MRRLMAGVAALLLAGFTLAQNKSEGEPKDKAEPTRAEQVNSLQKEFAEAHSKALKVYTEAKEKDEKSAALQEYLKVPAAYLGKFMDLAEAKVDDDAAFDALLWVVRNGQTSPRKTKAVDLLKKNHAGNEKLLATANIGLLAGIPECRELVESLIDKIPEKEGKGAALNALGGAAMRDAMNYRLTDKEISAKAAVAEKYFDRILKECPDAKYGRGTMGERANDELYTLKHLFPGNKAPEITAEDLDAKEMKLSQYVGRVVMLDFWGDW